MIFVQIKSRAIDSESLVATIIRNGGGKADVSLHVDTRGTPNEWIWRYYYK